MRCGEIGTTLLLCLLSTITGGQLFSYDVTCSADVDCPESGTRCYKDYKGCNVGTCGCVYGNLKDGTCVRRREADGCSCTSDVQCPHGLECVVGQCACVGRMVDNGAYCLKPYELLLGAVCGSGQNCLHRKEGGTEFVTSDVVCQDTVCTCRPGLVQDGWTCRRFRPDERGCFSNADCSGDSICKQGNCQCPAGHRAIDGKCGTNDATTNLAEGRVCDEILMKDRFCARGLECIRCGEDFNFRCRKYIRSPRSGTSTCSGSTITYKLQYASLITCTLLSFIIGGYL